MIFFSRIFSRLKISTKLVISSAVFLIPIGVMLLFICLTTAGIIQKSIDSHEGIVSLKPAVTVIKTLPEYCNVYLGLEQGDLRRLDEQISLALRAFDRGMDRYETEGKELPDFLADWEKLKKIDKTDEELYQKYLDFFYSLKAAVDRLGEGSRLILVSNMDNYYLVTSVFSGIPETAMRLVSMGNLIRQNLHDADAVIERWNNDLAAAHAQGRRQNVRPFAGKPEDMTMSMLTSADLQVIRNNNIFLLSDKERISASLESAMANSQRTQRTKFQ